MMVGDGSNGCIDNFPRDWNGQESFFCNQVTRAKLISPNKKKLSYLQENYPEWKTVLAVLMTEVILRKLRHCTCRKEDQ